MEPGRGANPAPVDQALPRDYEQLIRKLRWIGLEEEAKRLESAVCTLPPEERAACPSARSAPTSRRTHALLGSVAGLGSASCEKIFRRPGEG